MTSLQTDVIIASAGFNSTDNIIALEPDRAQMITSFLNDRKGTLRGAGQFTPFLTGVIGGIFGLATFGANLYYVGTLAVYQASVNLPVTTYPPAVTVLSNISAGAITGSPLRLFSFQGEIYAVNSTQNWRFGTVTFPRSFSLGISNNLSIVSTSQSGASGLANGTYSYFFTQVDSLGRESSPSQITTVTVTGGPKTVTITFPTTSYNAQVSDSSVGGWVNLYRTLNGGSVYYRVNGANITPATTTYADSVPDATLALNPIGPNFGENSPPTLATFAWEHQNRIWSWCEVGSGNQTYPTVQYTNYGSATQLAQPTGVDVNGNPLALDGGQITVSSDSTVVGVCGCSFGAVCGIWTRTARYIIAGTDSTNYTGAQKIDDKGCIAPDSLAICNEYAVWLGDDGIYATSYDGGFAEVRLSGDIDAIIFALNGTHAGRVALESSVGFYVDGSYNLLLNGTLYRWDFQQKGWTSFTPSSPVPNFAAVLRGVPGAVSTVILGVPNGPSGPGSLEWFDTHTPNQTMSMGNNNLGTWVTRPVVVEGRRPYSAVIQVKTVRIYGTGSLVNATLTGYMDTQTEVHGAGASPTEVLTVVNTAQGFLIEQEWSDIMRGRVFYVGLTQLNGTSIVITSCEVDYEEVG